MSTRWLLLISLASIAGSCADGGDAPPVVPPDPTPDPADTGCPPIFAQGIVPEYRVTIAPAEWAAMQDEFLHREERVAAGLPPTPYHPIAARYDDGLNPSVEIPQLLWRLKGASSWAQTVALDADPKMQFVLAWNEVDPAGRFFGVRKVELDMPRTDRTFLRQRLALHYLRTAGTSAQCANSAKLYVNGEYYGLYTHLERPDKEWLQRIFPDAADGDLWDGGRVIETNEDTFSWQRLDTLWHVVATPGELDELADLDASLHEWAAEAVIGDADGYYNGRANFFLYDHPSRGFVWLPHDLDTAFDGDFLPAAASPVFPLCAGRWEPDWKHYLMVQNDPTWADRYVAALAQARAAFDPEAVEAQVATWGAQIAAAATDDPHRPFAMADHRTALALTAGYAADRAAYLDRWLACRGGGGASDGDGDGAVWCRECDDADPALHPGALELCNLRDDDCDGRIDDDAACP